MRRRYLLPGALLAIILVILVVLAASHLQPYEQTIDSGPSPEARANPWLAAERFLQQRGIAVETAHDGFNPKDRETQARTLLLLGERSRMTPAQVERLLDWVQSGGRLVFVAEQLWDEETGRSGDLLLDRLQIHQLLSSELDDLQQEARDGATIAPVPFAPPARAGQRWPQLTRLYLENEDAPAYMSFDPAFHLEDPEDRARYWANSAGATHMLQLVQGQGLVTILTDAELWKNDAIGRHDNAWLLWYLTQDSAVTLVTEAPHDSLPDLLLRHFPQALGMLAVLLALGMWRVALREGPVQWPAPAGRRRLGEHVRASAGFMLRRQGQQALLTLLRKDILRRARRRHPGFETLDVAQQWQVLGRLTRQPTGAISAALRPRPRPAERLSSAEFTRQVAHLQTLRNAL